ncbi:MAG: GTP-binding protein [Pseudomonadota bacterium]
MTAPIPITIITGFLGAGKTTVLNALLRDPAFAETAVLINEFGDVQVDHDLVADFSDELVMTTTGCICCTASSDIKQSLYQLWLRKELGEIGSLKRVLVETTGLMDPAPVVNALLSPPTANRADQVVSQHFAFSRLLTLFDIVNGTMTLEHHPEALKQLALADAVLLTKTDMSSDPATLRDIELERQRIRRINSSARILDRHTDWSELNALLLASGTYDLRTKGEDAVAWLNAEKVLAETEGSHGHENHHHHGHDHSHHHDHDHVDRTRHGDDIQSHVIMLDEPVSPVVFFMFLESLKMSAGTDLLRIKGLVALSDDPDRPVVVHGVQHIVHPIDKLEQWPTDDKRTKIVLIGRNLNVDSFREILKASRQEWSNSEATKATA